MLFSRFWAQLTQYASALPSLPLTGQQVPSSAPNFPEFAFSDQWQILGPFQLGTREAPWSSDPLELYGGFHSLEYDVDAKFRSALAFNGSISWLNHTAKLSDPDPYYSQVNLDVDFLPSIDWPFLQDVYGWAGHQWLGWARGEIFVQSKEPKTLILDFRNVVEYWVDDLRFVGGDFYGYGRAPLTLHLEPGIHRVDVKLVGDVRSAGGIGSPTVDVGLILRESLPGLSMLKNGNEDILMADVIGDHFGPLTSPYMSVTVRNDAMHDVYVHGIEGMEDVCKIELIADSPIKLVSTQTRPINFRIACIPSYNRRLILHIKWTFEGEKQQRSLFLAGRPKVHPEIAPSHRFTFLHPSGIVSWAILRPPSVHASCGGANASLPVMLSLHGAGVNANDDPLVHMYDPLPDLCTWLLLPQGTTSWAGDDWHNWGFADVEAAIAAIPDWIEQVEWQGPGVDIDRWLVTGHSNGGQGVWYALSHRPDKIIAAAALSGYSSIQNYVPYTSWRTADPAKEGILQAALSTYRHDLLMENAKDIPVLIQHGSKDTNVPAYHSRLMDLRLFEAGGDSRYFEIPDEPHYWDGVGTTKPLRYFLRRFLNVPTDEDRANPSQLRSFTIVVADPGDMGPKNGVQVQQLESPGQLGKMKFTFDPLTWACVFHTTNVRSFSLPHPFDICDALIIDRQAMNIKFTTTQNERLVRRKGMWMVENEDESVNSGKLQRQGRQLGQLDSILRTHGAFQIVRHSNGTQHVALQISRNLAQYFAGDTVVTDDYAEALASTGNVISVAIGDSLPPGMAKDFAIQIGHDSLSIFDHGVEHRYWPTASQRLAAIFLRPLPDERLELVVWGLNPESLDVAVRLVPIMTGSGQPDWVVMDETMMWKGVDGTLAMGFFDADWQISRHSYFV
ncbi:hypothetical protein BDY17DRAFT_328315 [Neohortaea acidophila]|uniref:Peptidase S9 prolyl oligopeptidase catalytic domain-containing protein n=1 Tax=Neohortaea acidophila TaxID=245834 RepID=A0A6A6PFN9_9PEZI|nr:uncharacterized protein BDY17DRAFT_328315 [Neohortaea acidophila]KAF2478799.1 hypothetical protein BDY17DRAFT_328315 [Neohortaea acidophila]